MPHQNFLTVNAGQIEQPRKHIQVMIVIWMFFLGTDVFQIVLGLGGAAGLIKFVLLMPLIWIIATNTKHLIRGVFAMPELSALVVLAVISTAWSVNPVTTLERAFPLIILSATAIILGSMLSLRGLIITLGFLASLVVAASFLAIISVPAARGAPPWDDVWRGIFNHKNELGTASVMSLMISVSAIGVTKGHLRKFFAVVALGALVLLIASQSRTSQIVGFFTMFALLSGLLFQRRAYLWFVALNVILLGVIGVVYVLFASGMADQIIETFGRKTTLSGRLPLWQLVWPKVEEHFWLGYGYSAFWDVESKRVVEIARDITIQYTPNYSHNGLIETWLNIGFFGVALFGVAIVRIFRSTQTVLRVTKHRIAIVAAFTILVMYIFLNLTESSILSRESLAWMIFISLSVKLGVIAKTAKGMKAPHLQRPLPIRRTQRSSNLETPS